MQKCQLVPNISNGTNCHHLCVSGLHNKWASMPRKEIKRVSKSSENLYNSGLSLFFILSSFSRHHPLSIWFILNLCFLSSALDAFFFRNVEKTACDTKISNSLAAVQPNNIIVIIFRLDVLVNVSLFRPLFPLAQS